AVCEYSGEPIVELGREPRIATVSLDLAAQAAYREKLPFLRDADDYTFAKGKD
ncbi:MAG: amidohydrolase, partial [Chromatiales bacterium]